MKALITGASSGIGKDMAIYLNELGFEIDINKMKRMLETFKEIPEEIIPSIPDIGEAGIPVESQEVEEFIDYVGENEKKTIPCPPPPKGTDR